MLNHKIVVLILMTFHVCYTDRSFAPKKKKLLFVFKPLYDVYNELKIFELKRHR